MPSFMRASGDEWYVAPSASIANTKMPGLVGCLTAKSMRYPRDTH